jgi:YidC/Oxa1 family membrane protein insertase
MDKRSLLAIVLSFLILIVYQELIAYLYPPIKKPVPTQPAKPFAPAPSHAPQPSLAEGTGQQAEPTPPVAAPAPAAAGQDITVENEVYTAVFSSLGGQLKSLRLKRYPGDAGRDSPPREMVQEGTLGELPLAVRL